MNFSAIGDLANSLMMRRQGSSLRQELASLTQELASGQSRDTTRQVAGNFSALASIEHSLKIEVGFAAAQSKAHQILDFSQQSLAAMHASLDDIAAPLLAASSSGSEVQFQPFVSQGPSLLNDLVSFANTQHAGNYLFSGVASGTKPIADPDDLLADLTAETTGLTAADDFIAAIDAWFETPGFGFQVNGYVGGDAASSPLSISNSKSVTLDTTANDRAFRDSFKHAATLALIDRGDFAGTAAQERKIVKNAAVGMLSASDGLVGLQADLGVTQNRVETAQNQSSQERSMLQTLRNDITSVNPYEVATKLEATQTQLAALYLVTASMSRLKLSEYLR